MPPQRDAFSGFSRLTPLQAPARSAYPPFRRTSRPKPLAIPNYGFWLVVLLYAKLAGYASTLLLVNTLAWDRGYNEAVIRFALFLCVAGILAAQNWPLRPANLTIRFEPDAILQTGAPIPFKIQVTDSEHNPVVEAKVTLEIHRPDHSMVTVYKASAIDRGIYVAKPVFPAPGAWEVYVEVRWEDQHGGRTIEYNVPKTAAP
jgi:hypothetical protein